MALNLVKISNILNLLTQEYEATEFYHFGWRSDINRNIDNNYDIGQSVGRLFPAVHLVRPENINLEDTDSDKRVWTLRIYFDDLLHYNNDASAVDRIETSLIQLQELQTIAEQFIKEFDRWGRVYGLEGKRWYVNELTTNGSGIDFKNDEFQHKDRLLSIYCDINVVGFTECLEPLGIDPTTRLDWPVAGDDYEARSEFAFAGWDTAEDGEIDDNPVALFLDDAFGTFRSTQFILDNEGEEFTGGIVTIRVEAKFPYNGQPDQLLGEFSADIGSNLADDQYWTNVMFSIYDFFGITNITGHNERVTFTKLPFAQLAGYLNVDASNICITIGYADNDKGITSVNNNRTLLLPTAEISGLYNTPADIAIDNEDRFFVSEISGASAISQNFIDRFYNTRKYATDNNIVSSSRIQVDTITGSGDLYFCESIFIFYARKNGVDANGFSTFDPPIQVFSFGYFTIVRPFVLLDYVVNGKPLLMAIGLGGQNVNFDIAEWNGTGFTRTTLSGSPFSDNPQIVSGTGFMRSYGNSVYYSVSGSSTLKGLTMLNFSDDPRVLSNWNRFDFFDNLSSPDLGGIDGYQGIEVDFVNTINNYPVFYVCSLTRHVLIRVSATVDPPLSKNNFQAEVIGGQQDNPGNVDGFGTDALLTSPLSIRYIPSTGNYRIVCITGAHILVDFNPSTNEFKTVKGEFGVPGQTLFQEY